MKTNILQAQYNQLDEISNRFTSQAEALEQMQAYIRGSISELQEGGWQGDSAQTFFSEMSDLTLPALTRLQEAFTEANHVVLQIIRVMRQAEEEAAGVFQNDRYPTESTTEKYNTGLDDKSSKALVVKDPKEVFSQDYMQKMIGSHFQGENSQELNQLMTKALSQMKTPAGKIDQQVLDQIAELRGVDREIFRQQYQTFENLWRNAKDEGNIEEHDEYMGSTVSMRYGKVVGDVFGIDPVFGSMLNPTGGLVGPGDMSYQPDVNDAIGYHGVFHDAGGYLYNEHGEIGPGYDYLNRESMFNAHKSSPLHGQVGGITWWMSHPELNIDIPSHNLPDIPYVPEFLEPTVGDIAETALVGIRPLTYGLEGGIDIIDGIGTLFQRSFRAGSNGIMEGAGTILGDVTRTGAEQMLGRDTVNSVMDLSSRLFGWP